MTVLKTNVLNLIADSVLGEAAPPVGQMIGKFVLVAGPGELTLVLGLMTDFPYHAGLVERFCRNHGVAATWTKEPDQLEIQETDYRSRGGGWVEIDRQAGTLRFSGASKAYGEFSRGDLNYIVTNHPFFSGFSVTVVEE